MPSMPLSEYLRIIGQETHDSAHVDAEGTMRSITKDEQLAREVWHRALGHEEEITNEDGSVTHRIFSPDPKAQAFIFERREGKVVTPSEGKSITLLERISELAKSQINKIAEQSTDDRDSDQSET